ncbi:hypothetical protein PU560_00970, partial [Georgenia sp. 10Sc9-8]|nr:hypothetical protein [Georgenia halotolerans]
GEAWRVDVELRNRSGGVVDLGAVVLTADLAGGRPVSPVSGDPGVDPLVGEVGPGRSVRGSYLFTVPPGAGDELRLSFSYDVEAPVVVFTGSPEDV